MEEKKRKQKEAKEKEEQEDLIQEMKIKEEIEREKEVQEEKKRKDQGGMNRAKVSFSPPVSARRNKPENKTPNQSPPRHHAKFEQQIRESPPKRHVS
jgi:hypothetical protein